MVHPELLWAQRSSADEANRNIVYLTINAADLSPDYSLEITSGNHLSFKGKTAQSDSKGTAAAAGGKEYEFELDLYEPVEVLRKDLRGKSLLLVLKKKEMKEEYWPRLTKDKIKSNFIKTDFNLWKDEDEQDDEPVEAADEGMGGGMGGMPPMGMGGPPGAGGMDFASMMQGMGGMGGMGGAGGAGGAGGMDMEAMLKQMQAAGVGGPGGEGFEGGEEEEGAEDSSDDDGPPPLEAA
ncbi:p23/wos2 family protein [Sporobolomyces salmoneus]|uniref:p23/wos2 family protein n=1 Tax=Sporobolomyces salmoneus TaxID=183962 RepID=UPI00316C1F48